MDYIKLINRMSLVLLIIFLIWYYLPENKEIRTDPCSSYAVKNNDTCYCIVTKFGYTSSLTIFYSNSSILKEDDPR
jgi:hypothetical protein